MVVYENSINVDNNKTTEHFENI